MTVINANKISCPVKKQEVNLSDCKEMQGIFEEIIPLDSLEKTIDFTDENQQTCLQCTHHCK